MKQRFHSKSILVIFVSLIIIAIIGIAVAYSYGYLRSNIEITDVADPGSEPEESGFNYSWVDNHPYVAHAFGGILGNSYTNSYEAFLLNYQLGHRIFEVDFYLTTDNKTVAAHDADNWRKDATINNSTTSNTAEFTYDNFMSSLWYSKYRPVDLETLFHIMAEYPDIYIITDTKFFDEANVRQQFTAFLESAQAIDEKLLDRFIVQIYKPEMLNWIMEVYPWKSVIYTLYANPSWTPEDVLAFAQSSGVKFITLWDNWLTTEISALWESADIKIGTHTINNYANAEDSRKRGADVVYTDFLYP